MKPLKFLGIEYNPKSNVMRGKSRNGSTIECPRLDFLEKWQIWSDSDYRTLWTERMSGDKNHEKLIKTDLWGLAFALMYSSPTKAPEKLKAKPVRDAFLPILSGMQKMSLDEINASSRLSPDLMTLISELRNDERASKRPK